MVLGPKKKIILIFSCLVLIIIIGLAFYFLRKPKPIIYGKEEYLKMRLNPINQELLLFGVIGGIDEDSISVQASPSANIFLKQEKTYKVMVGQNTRVTFPPKDGILRWGDVVSVDGRKIWGVQNRGEAASSSDLKVSQAVVVISAEDMKNKDSFYAEEIILQK